MEVTIESYQQYGNDTWTKVRELSAEASVRMAGQCVADVVLSTAAGREMLEFSLAHGWCRNKRSYLRLDAPSLAALRAEAELRGYRLPAQVPRNRPLCGHAREKRRHDVIPEQTELGWEE